MVYDFERIRYQFDTVKPDFVIVSHASNVFGLIAPVEDIFALAKKYDAITLSLIHISARMTLSFRYRMS